MKDEYFCVEGCRPVIMTFGRWWGKMEEKIEEELKTIIKEIRERNIRCSREKLLTCIILDYFSMFSKSQIIVKYIHFALGLDEDEDGQKE